MQTRRQCLWGIAALAVPCAGRAAPAPEWPQRSVRIVVPFAVGGHSDIIARLIAQPLSEAFGQQFIVENKTGAAGVIAAEAVARAAPDGYTLFMGSPSQIAITPAMTKTAYDPVKDFEPVSVIGTSPYVLVVHPGLPVKNIAEFVAYARGRPSGCTYVSSGVDGMVHLATALFQKRAGLAMIPVTYKGGSEPINDVIAGRVDAYFANSSVILPHVASGTLRPLATSGATRARQLPDVPTFIEAGFPGFTFLTWNGPMAPAGTPEAIVARLAREIARAAQQPKIAERLANIGVDPLGNSPAQFADMVAADIALWREAVRSAGLREN
jgi:tripartite-type tricarboxylate transporter receptor subunit TctC